MRDEEKTVVGPISYGKMGIWDLIRRQLTHIRGSNAVEGQRMWLWNVPLISLSHKAPERTSKQLQ